MEAAGQLQGPAGMCSQMRECESAGLEARRPSGFAWGAFGNGAASLCLRGGFWVSCAPTLCWISGCAVLDACKRSVRRRRYHGFMGSIVRNIGETALICGMGAAEALAETLWPTRCAVCDVPGLSLCASCAGKLAYIDWWRACPRCGAPFGAVQCSECNDVMLAALGRAVPALDGCASAVVLDAAASRIVRMWKDSGERALAKDMAHAMARYVPPSWLSRDGATVVVLPASAAARRRRGFDHGEELARALAAELGLCVSTVLARPRARDQRTLARRGRIENMAGRFRTLPGATAPASAVLVDDVCTTGATASAAADALREAGALTVRCVTFARAW